MNDSPKKTILDHAVDAVSATLQTLPFTGGLAKYLDEFYPGMVKRQIQHISEELRTHAERVEVVRCDLTRLQTLTNTVLAQSLTTSSIVKRASFRQILANYASGKSIDDDTLDTLVYCLSGLTELQIRMIQLGQKVPDAWDDYIKSEYREKLIAEYFPGYPDGVLMSAHFGLIEKGLVQIPYRVTLPHHEKELDVYRLRLTPFGSLLLEWIKNEDAPTTGSCLS